ncbi:cyclin-D1-binding protein 1 homolog [Physella acuta]|uniref:cyclin-D1-binding protein 1 homolog n=1 Tax=Physella acuta TaxID=109671 RepID=UPI0027DAD1BB|nr:cyclin-D1-binding protein 1 homolog [Physella acuta]
MASNVNVHNNHDQSDIFKNLRENIQLVSRQITDGVNTRKDAAEFDKETYWNKIAAIFKILSMETTKLSLAFSKKPFPSNKNTEALVQEMEKAILTLVSIYYSLPTSQGSTLKSHLQQAVLQVLDNLQQFVLSLSDCINSQSDKRIQWTGGVWEASNFVLLRDNRECVLKDLQETYELVQDALQELEKASSIEMQDDLLDEDNDKWSEHDKTVISACGGLVKTLLSIVKKTRGCVEKSGDISTNEGISTLDELSTLTSGVSSVVDDFVSGIYPPMDYDAFVQNGEVLSEVGRNIIKFLKDCKLTNNEDTKWLDFLTHACSHNLEKLKASVLPS